MRGGEGVEVDWGDILEELALMEDADEVSADESTKTVSSDRELLHGLSPLPEFLYFFKDLARNNGIEEPSRTRRINKTRIGRHTSSATRSPP